MKKILSTILPVAILSGCVNLGDNYQGNLAEMESIIKNNSWAEVDITKFPAHNGITGEELLKTMKEFEVKTYFGIDDERKLWTRLDVIRKGALAGNLKGRTLIAIKYDCQNENNDKVVKYFEEWDSEQIYPIGRDIIKTESYPINKAGHIKQTQYFSNGLKRERNIYRDPALIKLSQEQLDHRAIMKAKVCSIQY